MKKNGLLLLLAAFILIYGSCGDAIDDAIDCTTESWFLSMDYEIDPADSLLVHFTFINGDTVDNRFNLEQNINWEFGDGTNETSQGLEISHKYSSTGSYDTKAHYTLSKGSSSCSSYEEKTINLE